MKDFIKQFRELRALGFSTHPSRGTIQKKEITSRLISIGGIWLFIISTLVSSAFFIIFFIAQHQPILTVIPKALSIGLEIGLLAGVIYLILPVFFFIYTICRYRQWPLSDIELLFSGYQLFTSMLVLFFAVLYLANHGIYSLLWLCREHTWPTHWLPYYPMSLLTQAMLTLSFSVILFFILPYIPKSYRKKQKKWTKKPPKNTNAPFGLWLGLSTGWLINLSHRTGMDGCMHVVLSEQDASQNLLVLGGIGQGKTTRIMQPLLMQLFDQSCGGLLFDVKGDVKQSVKKLSDMTNRPVTIIGPHHQPINLLAGLTPEVASSFLKSAFLLSGGTKTDGFWIDTATQLCRHTLGVLSFLPEKYTLQGLYGYLFDTDVKESIQDEIDELLFTLEAPKKRLLNTYLSYHDTIFSSFDEKVISGVKATVSQALAPFNHPDLIDVFCKHDDSNVQMESILSGAIYLADIPLAQWGLGGKVAYTFIKLRFFNMMQNRIHHPEWNQDKPVFFMCDEYQELISASKDGLSDLNFWDKSRSSKTIGIVSAQSVSSFYAAIGDHDLTHAILQNFRQKICFRTEDPATLIMMDRLAGKAKTEKVSSSETSGTGESHGTTSSHSSSTYNVAESRESVLDSTLFRQLFPDQAVVLLSLKGYSMDDVIELIPIYL